MKRMAWMAAIAATVVVVAWSAGLTSQLVTKPPDPQFTLQESALIDEHAVLRNLKRHDAVRLRRILDENRIGDAPGGGRSSAEASYDLLQLIKKAGQQTTQ